LEPDPDPDPDPDGLPDPDAELKKVGSTLPERSRFSPGTHRARNYLKDVWISFQAGYSMKIA